MRYLLALALLTSCGLFCPKPDTTPKPVVPAPLPEVRIIKTWTACLETAPPVKPEYAPLPGDQTPPPCLACFPDADARALLRYMNDLETWAKTAWSRCKNKPEKPEGDK